MSKKDRRSYDPYRQKQNIYVPYIRYSREAVKRQNRAVWMVTAPAFLLTVAALILEGIAQDAASSAVRRDLYRIAIPICCLLSAALYVRLIFIIRKAYRGKWYCIYSSFERALMENRLPLFRAQEQQDMDGLEKGFIYGCLVVFAAIMVTLGIWSLCP